MGWGIVRVVTTGWRRVVTTLLAQLVAANDRRRALKKRLAQTRLMTMARKD
jgi:hypothetical protein